MKRLDKLRSTIYVSGDNREVQGVMCVSMMSSAAVASHLYSRKRIILKRVKPWTHNFVYLLPERDVSWDWPVWFDEESVFLHSC